MQVYIKSARTGFTIVYNWLNILVTNAPGKIHFANENGRKVKLHDDIFYHNAIS